MRSLSIHPSIALINHDGPCKASCEHLIEFYRSDRLFWGPTCSSGALFTPLGGGICRPEGAYVPLEHLFIASTYFGALRPARQMVCVREEHSRAVSTGERSGMSAFGLPQECSGTLRSEDKQQEAVTCHPTSHPFGIGLIRIATEADGTRSVPLLSAPWKRRTS